MSTPFYLKVGASIGAPDFECDTISERTSAGGIVIDGTTIKDGGVTMTAAGVLKADTISEVTGANGVVIDSVTLKDGDVINSTFSGGFAAMLPREVADPGNGGAVPITASGVVPLVTAGAETRTVADPTQVGLRLTLFFLTDVGDCVVTFASPVSGASTIGTFADALDLMDLVSIRDGAGTFRWFQIANVGVALS